jgi:death-on-curing protein
MGDWLGYAMLYCYALQLIGKLICTITDSSADIYDLAAALICGIIQNHPFNDGNKRTGLLSGFLLLRLNGIIVNKLPVAEWYAMTLKLATHEISEQQFADFLRNFHE